MASPLPQLTLEQQKELQEKLKKMSPEELMEFQKQQCIFCQIISGKIPAKKLYEDDQSLIILDINPASRGHLLLFPKKHYAILPQLNDALTSHLFGLVKKYSKVLLKSLKADGTTVFIANGLVAGQKAQHFMIHLIPRKEGDSLINLQEKGFDSAEVQKVSIAIGNKLNELLGMKKEVVDDRSEERRSLADAKEKKAILSSGDKGSSVSRARAADVLDTSATIVIEDTATEDTESAEDAEDAEDDDSREESEQKIPQQASQKKVSSPKKESKSKKLTKDNSTDTSKNNEDRKGKKNKKTKQEERNTSDDYNDGASNKNADESDDTVSLDDIANLFR